MTVRQHVALSVPLAGIWFACFGEPLMALIAAASSVLMDVDHLIDNVIEERRYLGLRKIVGIYEDGAMRTVMMVFHSWELLAFLGALSLFTQYGVAKALAAGMGFHLLCDSYYWLTVQPRIRPLSYFFLYRLFLGFDAGRITVNTAAARHQKVGGI